MPPGIPYIIGNEFAERFSFYGMKGILVVYMTKYLLGADGELDVMSEEDATGYYHLFTMAVYLTPLFGGLLADVVLGKYRTIMLLSMVYVLGHGVLAINDQRLGLAVGLGLIAVGAGGIKPCVSAHVGDQFGSKNSHKLSKVFSWFYFAINLGSWIAMLTIPLLLEHVGAWAAFGVPGLLMLIATIVFWMGRNTYVHIPPGGVEFLKETFSPEGIRAMLKLSIIYVFVLMFWALFDQTGSTWVLQANDMDRNLLGREWLPSQIQSINPMFILMFIPLFNYGLYPLVDKVIKTTPLGKIAFGLFLTAVPFAISAWIEQRIINGESPSILWQVLQYAILTAAEVMVSITALEFSYTQAPKKMKSWIMGLFFASVALGNAFTAFVNFFIQNPDGSSKLEGASYFLFFAGTMGVTAVVFLVVLFFYKEEHYLQDDAKA
jgi:POT family proton-dependent oligopeptide transporter